jgi:hypothetical protein
MSKFNGWYFQTNGEDGLIYIVSKEFWEQNGTLDDNHVDSEIAAFLPDGFYEDCESMFSTDYYIKDARVLLKAAGFKEMKLLENDDV